MKLWERIALTSAGITAIYFLWHHEFHGVEMVMLTITMLVIGRLLYTSNAATNPLGAERDYSLKPVAIAVFKSLLYFTAAFLWVVISLVVVRRWHLPDTLLVAIGFIGPGMALVILGAYQLWVAMTRFQFGRQRRAS